MLGEPTVRPSLWALLSCLKFTGHLFPNHFACWLSDEYPMLCHCFLISSSPPLENCGNTFLIPISWHLPYSSFLSADFQSPQMSFCEPGIFDSYCYLTYLEFNSIYSTHSSEKSLIFRWRWKSNIGAQFSLCHLRTWVLLRELGLLFLDLKRFVIFICQRWHASCGILSTLHFHIGFWLWALTLPRLLLGLWTF